MDRRTHGNRHCSGSSSSPKLSSPRIQRISVSWSIDPAPVITWTPVVLGEHGGVVVSVLRERERRAGDAR